DGSYHSRVIFHINRAIPLPCRVVRCEKFFFLGRCWTVGLLDIKLVLLTYGGYATNFNIFLAQEKYDRNGKYWLLGL
ncbi:hypothetical protein ACHAXS_002300, partial [Conticribra weissflogii]